MRIGLEQGIRESTVLWLPFEDGTRQANGAFPDRSLLAQTTALGGSTPFGGLPSIAPPRTDGPFAADGVEFSDDLYASTYRFDVTPGVDFADIGTAITVDIWAKIADGSAAGDERFAVACLTTGGGTKSAFELQVGTERIIWRCYNEAATSATLTAPVRGMYLDHWQDVRAVGQIIGGALHQWVFRGGCLLGYKVTAAFSEIATSSLPVIQVGGSGSDRWVGSLAALHIRAEADTDPATCPSNLGPERISRRQFRFPEIDLIQDVPAASWAASGGSYRFALADVLVDDLLVDRYDLVRVESVTTAGVATTYAEAGNTVDLDAAVAETFMLDRDAGYLYAGPTDPATLHKFRLVVRLRAGDIGAARSGRYYVPAVQTVGSGSRECPFWNATYPQGAGGTIALAVEQFPAGLFSEEASGVQWTDAAVTVRMLSDGMPWCSGSVEFWGYSDSQPEGDEDTVTVTLRSEQSKLYRTPTQREVANQTDWPNMDRSRDGTPWPLITGLGVPRVPLICLDTIGSLHTVINGVGVPADVPLYTYGWSSSLLPSARLYSWGSGNQDYGSLDSANPLSLIFNVDLEANTLQTIYAPLVDFWVSVDGFGAPAVGQSTPADTNQGPPVGDAADCYSAPGDQIQYILRALLSYSAAEIGSTFAATAARVERLLRRLGNSSLADFVRETSRDTLTTVYWESETQTVEWEDVVKADAVDHVLRDEDVLEHLRIPFDLHLAVRATGAARAYRVNPVTYELTDHDTATLDLGRDARHRQSEVLDLGITGCYNLATVETLLDSVVPLGLKAPIQFDEVTVPESFAGVKLFDVVDVAAAWLPAGEDSRKRVLRVHPTGGVIKLLLVPEEPWPADGTSDPTARAPRLPFTFSRLDVESGEALATTGAWTPIGTNLTLYQGGHVEFPAAFAHRLQAYADRNGGAANSDMQIRLAHVNPDGSLVAAIATFAGTPSSPGYLTALTSVANVPSADALLQWQYLLSGGVSGTHYHASWVGRETANVGATTVPPATLLCSFGVAGGASCPPSAGDGVPDFPFGAVNFVDAWPPAASVRWCLYADPNGATDGYVYVNATRPGTTGNVLGVLGPGYWNTDIARFGPIDAAGYYEFTSRVLIPMTGRFAVRAFYTCADADMLVHALSCVIINNPGE